MTTISPTATGESDPADHDGKAGLLPGPVRVARTGPPHQVPGSPLFEPESWHFHHARTGARFRGGAWLVQAVAAAQISGYGGGHFPTAAKWRWALAQRRPVTVVANAAESEPLSAKDATLLRLRPHLVLDGLLGVAESLGAVRAVLWLHGADTVTHRTIVSAIEERGALGLEELQVKVMKAPDSYLSGQSSAIAQGITGAPAVPTFRGFMTDDAGDEPVTVVHNVETLARVAQTALESAASGGAAAAPPRTTLLTVLTPIDRRVVELPRNLTMRQAVQYATGDEPTGSSGVLLGGYGGMWVRWDDIAELRIDEPAFRRAGLSLGAGIVAPLWGETCGIAETAVILDYLARASAGQCGPCLFGLPALAASVAKLRVGAGRRAELRRLPGHVLAVDGRGACHHPDGAARLVRTAVETFRDDVSAHSSGHPCRPARGTTIPVPEV